MTNYLDWMKSCYYITLTTHPAISVPAGFTDDGLPVGIQIVGRYRDDFGLLQFAHAFEQATAGLEAPAADRGVAGCPVRVAALAAADHPRWLELARGYKAFYKTPVTDAEYQRAWKRLLANDRAWGLGGRHDGQLVGITHYLFTAAPGTRRSATCRTCSSILRSADAASRAR